MEKNTDFLEKLVHINRITKVVKGGRRFGFSALVVVGNQNGKIGIAHAKAKQVPDAIKKANELARRNLIQVPLREGRTIHHDIFGKDGAGKIKLRAAPKGTGIIAGGPVRAVCEVLGIKDIVAKSLGTANPHNVIRACMKALSKQNSPKNISALRNRKKVKSVSVNRYRISVFKSLKNISAQIIDDKEKKTLVSASSIEKDIKSNKKKKSETSELLGEILAKRAAEKKITKVYFDRGSYKYQGRIKMFADSLRKNGLEF